MVSDVDLTKIKKRDGSVVDFDKSKIANAIWKAAQSVGGKDKKISEQVANQVVENLKKILNAGEIPTVEQVQDVVEKTLIESGHARTAKAYILYRKKRSEIREAKKLLGVEDNLKLSINAIKVLASRYLKKDEKGRIAESTGQLFRRVAKSIASAEKLYGKDDKEVKKLESEFYQIMTTMEFLPNSPTLMNAGTNLGQLAACFVLPVEDDMKSIFESIKNTALIHQSGGGTGFSFSRLRPKGDMVKSTGGVASGPMSFMKVFDAATDVIKQGGKRRGANMGMMRVDHPDILEFMSAKEREGSLANFNISVALTDKFMKAVEKGEDYDLINPRNGETLKKLPARAVFNLIVMMAWKNGEPGVIFIDKINATNPTPHIGQIESTNPCVIGNTLISTDNGLVRMKDLVEKYPDSEIRIATDNRVPIQIMNRDGTISLMQSKQSGISFNRISRAFCTGMKETYKIETESGYELVCTADHKVLTNEGWACVTDLDLLKHKVLIQSGEGKFSENYTLPFEVRNKFVGNNGKTIELNLPSGWSKELGQVLGWLIGDGWMREGDKNCRVGFTFSKDDKNVMNYLKPILNNWYNYEIKEVERENGIYHLSYHSKYFVEFFKKLGIKHVDGENKTVPESIFTAPKEVVVGFLQGLFTADGTVNFRRGHSSYVRLTSKSQKLLKDIQIILLNLGIKSRIYNRSRLPQKNKFSYVNKNGELKYYGSDGICYELEISRESARKFIKEIGFLCNKHQEKINKFSTKGFYRNNFEERIKAIDKCDEELVYDLTEPKTLSFISNGFLSLDCGEQPLLPYESCNLGSINLAKMIKKKNGSYEIDWEKLRKIVRVAIRFLDNVIDVNKYPIPEIEKMTKANRKIGLGVMGFADMLIMLGIPYNSEEGVKTGEAVMKFIDDESKKVSEELGMEKGSFPNFKGSVWEKNHKHMRNATTTTIAPTGTIGVIANASSGIEPIFAVSYVRAVGESLGHDLIEVNPLFEKISIEQGFHTDELMIKIARQGSVQSISEIPEKVRKAFATALDISPEWHVRMQSAFQRHTDNAVSKTINFPNLATPYDVEKAYMLAYKLGCKGITIYRYGSREKQILNLTETAKEETKSENQYDGGCPTCTV